MDSCIPPVFCHFLSDLFSRKPVFLFPTDCLHSAFGGVCRGYSAIPLVSPALTLHTVLSDLQIRDLCLVSPRVRCPPWPPWKRSARSRDAGVAVGAVSGELRGRGRWQREAGRLPRLLERAHLPPPAQGPALSPWGRPGPSALRLCSDTHWAGGSGVQRRL